jgi:RNA polymerase sigma-70 factor, ECF subfamily
MTVAVRWRSWAHPRAGWWALQPALARVPSLLSGRSTLGEAGPLDRQRLARLSDGVGAGDGAFEAFFRAHERAIFGYLWRITGDEHASYDLAQETFVRAWQRFERVRRYEQPRAWLFRVATNLASNHRRHRSVREAATSRLEVGAGLASDPTAGVVESDAVRTALDALPVRMRGALVLRVVYGLSLGELARALGTSEAAAKMTLSRARERFRTHYMQEELR